MTAGEVVIAFRQSVGFFTDRSVDRWQNDWNGTNLPQLAGETTKQYEAAKVLADAVRKVLNPAKGKLTLTGFSKGGGQASYAAAAQDTVVTFNGARNRDANSGVSKNQTNVIVRGDAVSDPNARGQLGPGRLPGEYISVNSTEPGRGLDKVVEHSLSGVLGGLFDAKQGG